MKAYKLYRIEEETWKQYSIIFETEAELSEFVAKFPKFVKVQATTIKGMDRSEEDPIGRTMPMASFEVKLVSNSATGEYNETGLKRLAKFHEIVDLDAIKI